MADASITRALVACASVFIIIAGIKMAQPIVIPVLVAFFLAILTSPGVSLLVSLKFPIGAAVTVVVGLLFAFFYGLFNIVTHSSEDFITKLPTYMNQIELWLVSLRELAPWLVNDIQQRLQDIAPMEQALGFAGRIFSGIGSVLTMTVLVIFTLIFALLEGQNAPQKVRLALGDDATINYVKRFSKMVQRYLLIKSLISLATGVLVAVFLWIFKVDYPIIWGTLAFLMNFIPNVGSLLAAIPPIIIGTIQLGLPGFFIVTSGFVAINMVIGNLIEPRLMGRSLDISPLVVFLSLVFWGWVLGPVGMLLAIPLTMVVKIGLELHPNTIWIAKILSH